MRSSMALSDRFRRPTSVFGVSASRRWLKSPAANRAAVSSTSRSGSNVAVTSSRVSIAPSRITETPNPRKITVNRAIVWSVSALDTATST